MNPPLPARAVAALVVEGVLQRQQSLSDLLPRYLSQAEERERPLVQELVYGTLRWSSQLEFFLKQLMPKPLKAKEGVVKALLFIGIYQLQRMRLPPYAAISETVNAVVPLRRKWARSLVNGVLRGYQRRGSEFMAALAEDLSAQYAHPRWLIESLQRQWPQQWQEILEAGNSYPPLTLRVNTMRLTVDGYCQLLSEAGIAVAATVGDGVTLAQPQDVSSLPFFASGGVSVQDGAAQLAARLVAPVAGERILDACAAPGGKTAHLLELAENQIDLTAVELVPERLTVVEESLQRLGLSATLIAGDAAHPEQWWQGAQFDAILVDAPCSATGVIRRHPDIKWLRHEEDIPPLVALQRQILTALWPLLRPGGRLLYATCSLLQQENRDQVTHFLEQHQDATALPLSGEWGVASGPGRAILPAVNGMDGFFYALICKDYKE
ncbi:MAG: 16S rRNA (cytosine(967)-C(5))-methyltransferase RsmB [Gammaproteobacteria bacterium]|nr:16S rRNA (cytosine(967)-C(5))-methyltransferase RsmB [Gammaproteobacteria bacterium]